jgi:hypothetical protein
MRRLFEIKGLAAFVPFWQLQEEFFYQLDFIGGL